MYDDDSQNLANDTRDTYNYDLNDKSSTVNFLQLNIDDKSAFSQQVASDLENSNDLEKPKKRKRCRPARARAPRPYVPDPKICDLCGQIYATPQILKTHIRCFHENIREFACTICSYRSSRKEGLKVYKNKLFYMLK